MVDLLTLVPLTVQNRTQRMLRELLEQQPARRRRARLSRAQRGLGRATVRLRDAVRFRGHRQNQTFLAGAIWPSGESRRSRSQAAPQRTRRP
jgi:hypothetical protein